MKRVCALFINVSRAFGTVSGARETVQPDERRSDFNTGWRFMEDRFNNVVECY